MSRPLVLLHGWGFTSRVWEPLTTRLDSTIDVLPLDLPGHGSAPPAGDDPERWIDALLGRLPTCCDLLGWSLGAQLALALAVRAPERVARLILLGASPRFVCGEDWEAGLAPSILEEFQRGFAADPGTFQRRFVALQSLGDRRRKDITLLLNATLTPVDTVRHGPLSDGLGLLAQMDLRPLLPSVTQPVRLIQGRHDKLMPAAAAEWMAAHLPDARLSLFEDSGHAPFLSRPADCATLIESFLGE